MRLDAWPTSNLRLGHVPGSMLRCATGAASMASSLLDAATGGCTDEEANTSHCLIFFSTSLKPLGLPRRKAAAMLERHWLEAWLNTFNCSTLRPRSMW